jgi:thiol-disulfide isomerase/thioredoxin
MPSFGGATEWLNSEPLGPAQLRGHVVIVDFWTLTCINWLRTEPYIRAWSHAYRDDGLVVIGVHTPEFSFEHDVDLVRQATKERGIVYPGRRTGGGESRRPGTSSNTFAHGSQLLGSSQRPCMNTTGVWPDDYSPSSRAFIELAG